MDEYKESEEGAKLSTLRKQFSNYASAKSNEIDEQRLAWRYYSGAQFTKEETAKLTARGQPVITFNRITRKVNGLIGTIRRLRTDPKAYPRTEGQQQAADLATEVVRYVLDATEFEQIETCVAIDAAVHGIGVAEMTIVQGDKGDPDIGLMHVDARTYFYDPRSTRPDFSDARYEGVYKWVSKDELEEIAPGLSDKIGEGSGGEFTTQAEADRDDKWVDEEGRYKLVDHWYIKDGMWKWCLHVGTTKIDSGESPFYDENGKSLSKFHKFSNAVDHEGDRYGLIRDLKGAQDAINQHRSKAMWIMNTRQIVTRRGSQQDIEAMRKEAMRPDGVIQFDGDPNDFRFDSPAQEFLQQTQYFEDAKNEIENFGPNPALIGTGVTAKSGRAMAMMQQAGLAELGPFLANYRAWKLGIYRAIWGATKRYWQAERWLRVTGDQEVAQFVQVNQMALDEMGLPTIVNALGAIDVDIVMDEGPDTENVQGDVYDTLQALAQNGAVVPPQVLIEMSALPGRTKEKLLGLMQEPDPATDAAKQTAITQEQAKTAKLEAETFKITTDGMVNQAQLGMPLAPMGAPPMGAPPMGMTPDVMVPEALPETFPEMGDPGMMGAPMAPQPDPLALQIIEQTDIQMQQLASALMALTQTLAQQAADQRQTNEMLIKALTAPKQIVRGPDGRAQGVQTAMM